MKTSEIKSKLMIYKILKKYSQIESELSYYFDRNRIPFTILKKLKAALKLIEVGDLSINQILTQKEYDQCVKIIINNTQDLQRVYGVYLVCSKLIKSA